MNRQFFDLGLRSLSLIFFLTTLPGQTLAKALPMSAEFGPIRGKARQFRPGAMISSLAAQGDKLYQGSSVSSGNSGSVSLLMADGNTVVMGPATKLIMAKAPSEEAGIIVMTEGSIKGKVIAGSGKAKTVKLFIVTPTGLVAIRGTEFIVTYNPHLQVTSVVTFKGLVAFKYQDNLKHFPRSVNKLKGRALSKDYKGPLASLSNQVKRTLGKNKENVAEFINSLSVDKLNLALRNKETVVVAGGHISMTLGAWKNASVPVHMSPHQITALSKNMNFSFKSNTPFAFKDVKDLDTTKGVISRVPLGPPAEGAMDQSKKQYVPKSGGFFDVKSGLYIPPSATAYYLDRVKVYAPEFGTFDSATGHFIAPSTLRIDPTVGLMKRHRSKSKARDVRAYEWRKHPKNTEILNLDLLTHGDGPRGTGDIKTLSYNEWFTKDTVTFRMRTLFDTLKLDDRGIETKLKSDFSYAFNLNWEHASYSSWRPYTFIGLRNIKYKDSDLNGVEQASETFFNFGLGLKINLFERVNFIGQIALNQEPLMDYTVTNSVVSSSSVLKFALTQVGIGLEGEIYKKGRSSFDASWLLLSNFDKKRSNVTAAMGLGTRLNLAYKYWPKRYWAIWLEGSYEYYSQKIEFLNYEVDATRSRIGLGLNTGIVF